MVASLPEVGQKMYSMKAITLPSRPQCAVCRLSRSAPSIRTLVFDGTESASALKHGRSWLRLYLRPSSVSWEQRSVRHGGTAVRMLTSLSACLCTRIL